MKTFSDICRRIAIGTAVCFAIGVFLIFLGVLMGFLAESFKFGYKLVSSV